MRTTITQPIALAMLVATCASCVRPYQQHPYYVSHPRCPAKPTNDDSHAPNACTDEPRVREYLETVKREVFDAWTLPAGIRASQKVEATLFISPTGSVRCLSLAPGTSDALANSVISAVERADPLPAMPSEATCLSEIPIMGTFSNPVER